MNFGNEWPIMALTKKQFIPDGLKNLYLSLLSRLIRWLADKGIHPNVLTTLTFLFSLLSGVVLAQGHLRLGGVLILVAGTFDILDGAVARLAGLATKFGAFYDSTLDRYAEFFTFFGILFYYLHASPVNDFLILTVCLAMCGSLMVSYVRARAEGLGLECKIGIMQRPERIVLLGFGAIFHENILTTAIVLIAVFANFTAVQRIFYIKSILSSRN